MCFFLYGSLYGDVSEAEYNSIAEKYEYKIARGTRHKVKMAVKGTDGYVDEYYRITDWVCDCGSPVGRHDPKDSMIIELTNLITELSSLSGAEQINICLTWIGRTNKREKSLKLKDLDLAVFLADMKEGCLYSLNI